ncbi:hypothetical protein AMK20_10345 [Streptomyces sp. TSRI0261]|nr:hypothetical protein AMK20_10345 [Streptomyces sp. TSRI0261]
MPDLASAQVTPVAARTVCLIGAQVVGAGTGVPACWAGNPNAVQADVDAALHIDIGLDRSQDPFPRAVR